MGKLWDSIRNWWRGKKEDVAAQLEDPIRDGKFAIEDSEKQLNEFQSQIAKYSGAIKVMERDKADKEASVTKWSTVAQKAAEQGDEAGLTVAVREKQKAQAEATNLEKEIAKNKKILEGIKDQFQKATNKVAQAKSNFTQLQTRQASAKIRKGLADASNGIGSSNAFAKLGELEKVVNETECEAEALEEMAGEGDEATKVAEKYADQSDASVNDEVAKMLADAKAKKAQPSA